MMDLRPSDFAIFFEAVHGCRPFPWQQALVDRLAEDDCWPDVLDLPTGSGKTAALDVAVFHLALRFTEPRRAALRMALVVDRRLVVDDAYTRARKIENALQRAGAGKGDSNGFDPIVEVARRLTALAGTDAPPLVARRLRGGTPLEHDWARTPTQPTILCSTVDQVGSRLLFRGYGVSDRMKPVHAGLLGVHTLILLDEAHLSEPFRQTLDAVKRIGGAELNVTVLTATPGAKPERPLLLSPADRSHPGLRQRLEARKPAMLRTPVKGGEDTVAKAFAEEAHAMATRLCEQGVTPVAVGVVVNRVALARRIFRALHDDDTSVRVLMIGRSRDVERDAIVDRLAAFRTGAETRSDAKSLFVIATQCLEVGVDLDLDGLVTQAASLDALRQRFGRLNRAGRPVPAEGTILARTEDIAKKADDAVYGDRIRRTWEALQRMAEGGVVDFGVDELPRRLTEAGIDADGLAAERPDAPVVMPAYLDLWSQTSPRPVMDPEVALFLHGAERTTAGVSVVWRSDITEADLDEGNGIEELLRLVPPYAAEAVEVPLWAARAWLNTANGESAEIADAPERPGEEGEESPVQGQGRRTFRWAGAGDGRTGVVGPDDLRPGDLVIVPSEYGGCDTFGWAPELTERVQDVADKAAEPYWGRRCAVRVTPDIVRSDAQWERLLAVLTDEGASAGDLVEGLIDVLSSDAAQENAEQEPEPRNVRESLKALQDTKGRIDIHFPYSEGRRKGAVFVAERGIRNGRGSEGAIPATENDSASHTSSKPIPLDDHGRDVEELAERFSLTLGLKDVAKDVRLAAYLHDAGKADPRFQTMLAGGDPWNRPDGSPLAKSGRSWSPTAWDSARLPRGWRHEALSVRMARVHPRFADARDPALVLWLIGSHHGLGRPFYGFIDPRPEGPAPCLEVDSWGILPDEAGPQSFAFDFDGADWPSLFEDLKRRYGIWRLAHLEAVLRLADHRASEQESDS